MVKERQSAGEGSNKKVNEYLAKRVSSELFLHDVSSCEDGIIVCGSDAL